jgi:hypothetical protein
MKKTIFVDLIDNEDGFLLVMSLMILTLLTIIGVSTSDTTRFELTVAANERVHNLAFYAAESARSYVEARTNLFDDANSYEGAHKNFPNDDDPDEFEELGALQSFQGDVAYGGGMTPPRGSGYEANLFMAHTYIMTCTGNGPNNALNGPNNALSIVQAGFYRIGFKN